MEIKVGMFPTTHIAAPTTFALEATAGPARATKTMMMPITTPSSRAGRTRAS